MAPGERRRRRAAMCRAYELLLTSGEEAARAYAHQVQLSVHEPLLQAERMARRDVEIRRMAALVAAGAHVQLQC